MWSRERHSDPSSHPLAPGVLDLRVVLPSPQDRMMALVTVPDTGEVTVPREVAEKAGLRPGHRLAALAIGSHVTLVPVRPLPAVLGVTRAGASGRRAGPRLASGRVATEAGDDLGPGFTSALDPLDRF